MGMTLVIASCLLLGSLLPDAFASFTPYLSLPKNEGSYCMLGDENCNKIIARAQLYIMTNLNTQRYWVASGSRPPMPVATNMLYLEDDEGLRDKAQKYVEDCIRTHGYPGRCRPPGETENDGDVSILIKRYRGELNDEPLRRIATAVRHWGSYPSEDTSRFVNFFDPMHTDKRFIDFAKMVHTRVWKVGCGAADYYVSAEEFQEIVVCFYGPPKLKRGDHLYSIGSKPCSNCPSGTSCLMEGQLPHTLCKVNEGRIPVFEDQQTTAVAAVPNEGPESGQLIWYCDIHSYNEECKAQKPCSAHWTVDTKDGYKYTKVSGTCVTLNVFLQEIYLKGPSCFLFEYKKEGSEIDSRVIGFASQVNVPGQHSTSAREEEGGSDWSYAELDIPWSNAKVQVGVIVRSRSTTDEEQTIKVRNFEIYTGSCSENQ